MVVPSSSDVPSHVVVAPSAIADQVERSGGGGGTDGTTGTDSCCWFVLDAAMSCVCGPWGAGAGRVDASPVTSPVTSPGAGTRISRSRSRSRAMTVAAGEPTPPCLSCASLTPAPLALPTLPRFSPIVRCACHTIYMPHISCSLPKTRARCGGSLACVGAPAAGISHDPCMARHH